MNFKEAERIRKDKYMASVNDEPSMMQHPGLVQPLSMPGMVAVDPQFAPSMQSGMVFAGGMPMDPRSMPPSGYPMPTPSFVPFDPAGPPLHSGAGQHTGGA